MLLVSGTPLGKNAYLPENVCAEPNSVTLEVDILFCLCYFKLNLLSQLAILTSKEILLTNSIYLVTIGNKNGMKC